MFLKRSLPIRPVLVAWAILILLATTEAFALDYRNLGENAIVYDGASRQASPQFILLKGTPVELIVVAEKWAKIRESSGGLGWVEKTQLTEPRQVMTTQAKLVVRQQANETSPAVLTVAKGVLLEVVEKPAKGWVKVKHRDGPSGFVPTKAIWGL